MQPKILTILFVAMLLTSAVYYNQRLTPEDMTAAPEAGKTETATPFPDITFLTPEGKPLHLQDLKEKVVLVHFWAAWCAPCRTEFPELLKYVEHSGGKIALLAVSLDDHYEDSRKVLEAAAATSGVNLRAGHFYWAWDKDKSISLHNFNTVKVPETIVVKDGLMSEKIIGVAPWGDAAIR